MSLHTEDIPRELRPLILSLKDLLGLETAAIPAEPKMSSVSPPGVSGSPTSQERPQLGSDIETAPQDREVDVLSLKEGNSSKQQIKEA